MERRLPYQELEKIIKSLGSIKKVATSPNIIRTLLTSDYDRHLLCALIHKINEEVEAGRLSYDELPYFRDGLLADDIINLGKLIPIYNIPRDLFESEILDKLNYISLINDEKALAANYTHPSIVAALCGKAKTNARDLTWWSTSGTFSSLPPMVQQRIMLSVMEQGDYKTAHKMCEASCYKMPTSKIEDYYPDRERKH